MQNLKVLMVIALFRPYVGGSEKQSEKLALELLSKNIEVTIVTGRWSNLLRKIEIFKGLKIKRNFTNFRFTGKCILKTEVDFFKSDFSGNGQKYKFLTVFLRKIFIRSSIYIYQISLFLMLLMQRKNYDILHVHQVLYPAFISTICAKILKKPIIVKGGSSGFNSDINQIKKFPEGRFQLRFILRNIDKLVCTSSKMKEEFLSEGMDKDKINLVPNGVSINNFNRSFENCNSMIYLGRFTKTKNIETLILAFSKIISVTNYNSKLVLVGDGPERDNIVNLIKKFNLEKYIFITGFVENTGYFLEKSDLFIFPSLIEGLSNSLIEAMSYKLPCIVSNIPGNVEVIGENSTNYQIGRGNFIVTKYSIIFNPGDIEGLSNSILFLIKNSSIRTKIAESAFEKVKMEYDIKLTAKKYQKLYKEVLKN